MSLRQARRTSGGGSGGSFSGAASDVTFDDSGLIIVNGTDVQAALEDIDAYLNSLGSGGGDYPWYGNGADGDATISIDTSITEDKYYENLTVDSGIILNTANWRVFVHGTLTLNGTISCNGRSGTLGTNGPGSAIAAQWYGASIAGTQGGINGAAGNNGAANTTNSLGSLGGVGGISGQGHAGGTTGIITVPVANLGGPRAFNNIVSAIAGIAIRHTGSVLFVPGKGGSGGGGAANCGGGGGGSGGGVCAVFARALAGTGAIQARGGAGNPGTENTIPGLGAGGGGGGGGGVVIFATESPTNPYTVDADGGIGGALFGTGTNGADGTAGRLCIFLGV